MFYPSPYSTSPALFFFVSLLFGVSVVIAFVDTLMASLFPSFSMAWWLSLSTAGWMRYYLWQPFTYQLFYPSQGLLTPSYFFELVVILYFLWIIGVDVCQRLGERAFFIVYFFGGALIGCIAIGFFPGYGLLQGPMGVLLALLTLWTMLGPQGDVALFFTIEIKRYWLFAGIAIAMLLAAIAHLDWLRFLWYFSAICFGYFYGTIGWHLMGPLPLMGRADRLLYNLGSRVDRLLLRLRHRSVDKPTTSKIFDFQTGELVLNDEAFMDAMLTKISEHGEASLSRSERMRMDEIALRTRRSDSDSTP